MGLELFHHSNFGCGSFPFWARARKNRAGSSSEQPSDRALIEPNLTVIACGDELEKMRVMIFKLMCPNVMLVHILCLQLIRLIQNPRLLAKRVQTCGHNEKSTIYWYRLHGGVGSNNGSFGNGMTVIPAVTGSRKNWYYLSSTGIDFIMRSRSGEVCSCCQLVPAWVRLNYVCAE